MNNQTPSFIITPKEIERRANEKKREQDEIEEAMTDRREVALLLSQLTAVIAEARETSNTTKLIEESAKITERLTTDSAKKSMSTEQLLEYLELTNRTKALVLSIHSYI